MKNIVCALGLSLFMVIDAQAFAGIQPSEKSMKQELVAIVKSQLECFRRDDYPAAYQFAAKGIHEMFGPKEFERMVRRGYPVLAKSTSATFGAALDNGKDAVLYVTVVDAAGQRGEYEYLLVKEGSRWRITAVQETKPDTSNRA